MDFDSVRLKINELKKKLNTLNLALDIENKNKEKEKLEKETLDPNFYSDLKNSTNVLSKFKKLDSILLRQEKIGKNLEDASEYLELAEEENDSESFKEAKNICSDVEESLDRIEIETLLSDKYDENNAIISIHPGAGGTESQDWALMLYRMYVKYASKNGFELELLDMQDGEEAGLKSVSFLVKGMYAYGYLKGENGVHRLVRISPFDSNSRRHTSFAAVEVMPEISDDIEINIKDEDLEMEAYRASGAGGQHINKTSSAVRIKHIPTGIVVTCQTERSQVQNRENCMKMLKAKLYKLEEEKKKSEKSDIKGETLDNGWASQIRSYVFCPYTLVKDHRTNFEIGNIQAVMDGKIDEFVYNYLKYIKSRGIM